MVLSTPNGSHPLLGPWTLMLRTQVDPQVVVAAPVPLVSQADLVYRSYVLISHHFPGLRLNRIIGHGT